MRTAAACRCIAGVRTDTEVRSQEMKWHESLRQRAWQRLLAVPALGVLIQAVRNYVLHQSANQAGDSGLLGSARNVSIAHPSVSDRRVCGEVRRRGRAGFPRHELCAAVGPRCNEAGHPTSPGPAQSGPARRGHTGYALERILGYAGGAVCTNRSYDIQRGLPFWRARIKSTLITVVVGAGVVAAFSSVIILPCIWQMLRANVGVGEEVLWLRNSVRYGTAFLALTVLYALLYGWLPDIRQRLYTVLPGAIVGAALWVGAAATLSCTLRSAGKLVLVYGSFTGVVATLVFLYVSATTLIYGAEVNAVLRGKAPADQSRLQESLSPPIGCSASDGCWLLNIAGLVARAVLPGRQSLGIIWTTLLGIAGAVIATYIGQALGWYAAGTGAGFIASVVGAVIVLALYGMIAKRK
jgi:membrane protein